MTISSIGSPNEIIYLARRGFLSGQEGVRLGM